MQGCSEICIYWRQKLQCLLCLQSCARSETSKGVTFGESRAKNDKIILLLIVISIQTNDQLLTFH